MNNSTSVGEAYHVLINLPFRRESYLTSRVLLPTWPVIILFGIFSNTTNIIVFLKTGIKDNVTMLLLSLSISDLTFLVLISATVSTFVIVHFAPTWPWLFDRNVTAFLLYWPAFTAYDFSSYIAVFLGVVRCACVALPLHFKSVFTKSRTLIVLIFILFATICLRIPVLIIHSFHIKTDVSTNRSWLSLKAHDLENRVRINDTLNRNTLPWIAYIVMVVCVVVLAVKLQQTAQVRQSYSNKSSDKPGNPGISAKESHVIKSVVLVCIIFIFSQLPFLTYSTARLVYPDFDQGKRLGHLFTVCSLISMTCAFLNASVNIFVYYTYNSKYRSVCQGARGGAPTCHTRRIPANFMADSQSTVPPRGLGIGANRVSVFDQISVRILLPLSEPDQKKK
ncbi:chemosensory receptor a [Plakobranchus ocellatus]|uniref:Chemosensory receptor a n=1 Tax=Plakobranchus ocellatus TaxID=259542 RepID=A0AAV3YLV9_9GAST|nr:chemosensory receptor a [Plakobranchus ocellatus]